MKEAVKAEIFKGFKEKEFTESTISRIMRAETVEELLALDLRPEEIPPLFEAVEEFSRRQNVDFGRVSLIGRCLLNASPIPHKKRVLFI